MSISNFMNKVRQWDNKTAHWVMRHFYILFFEAILVIIFVAVFMNALKVIDVSADIQKTNVLERLLLTQSVNSLLILILMLFNSFWMLYIFSSILRLRGILKNIDFNLSKRRGDARDRDRD